jgi:hypothetical protein
VRAVPDELGIEGGEGAGRDADARAERPHAQEVQDRCEERADGDLRPFDGLELAEGFADDAHEVRIERRMEHLRDREWREPSGRHLLPERDPDRLVVHPPRGRLEEDEGGPSDKCHGEEHERRAEPGGHGRRFSPPRTVPARPPAAQC